VVSSIKIELFKYDVAILKISRLLDVNALLFQCYLSYVENN